MSDDAETTHSTAPIDTGRAGIVLAGGRSKRFPTVDKALAPLDGKPLLWHVAEGLAPVVDELLVSCRRDQQEAFADALDEFSVRFVIDKIPDRGPLVGLRTALDDTAATYAAVVPCDMPAVPAAFLEFLFARSRNRTGAVPTFDGHPRPFPAVYHVRAARAACREVESGGDPRIKRLVDHVEPRVVDERIVRAHVGPSTFQNINTHDDLAVARDCWQ